MYSFLLALHSLLRWALLISLLYALVKSYQGWFAAKPFLKADNTLRVVTLALTHTQLLVGLVLYFVSPYIAQFLGNVKEGMHQKELRFFGMEHNVMMLIAITFITIGSVSAKKKPTDVQKFKTMALWFTAALVVIAVTVPWSFSPMVSRPMFRGF